MSRNAGVVRGIWLHMLADGGGWTVSRVSRTTGLQRDYADKIMRHMAITGLVRKTIRAGRKNGVAYEITVDCKIPGQTNLQDIAKFMPRPQVATCWAGGKPSPFAGLGA